MNIDTGSGIDRSHTYNTTHRDNRKARTQTKQMEGSGEIKSGLTLGEAAPRVSHFFHSLMRHQNTRAVYKHAAGIRVHSFKTSEPCILMNNDHLSTEACRV